MAFQRVLTLSVLVALASAQPKLNVPPQQPASYPPADELQMISGAFLQDPLVQQAWQYVQSVVPASVLAIAPSKFVSGATTNYTGDTVANCYWPKGPCVRASGTAYYQPDVVACPQQNTWGITYDDGPLYINGQNDTPDLLTHLKTQNINSTFFIVGTNAVRWPDQITAAYKAGHEIAVHTWTHHPMTSLTNEQVVAEIKYTEAIIYKSIGVVPALWRPPYGDIDDRIRAILWALGYRTVIWTTTPLRDTQDADLTPNATTAAQILNTVKTTYFQAQPGFISLEHDISNFTTNVAIQILDAIGAARASNSLAVNPIPVGQCMSIPVYQGQGSSSTGSNTTSSSSPTPTAGSKSAAIAASSASGIITLVLGAVGLLVVRALAA
ncbi:chitin deacetylase [Rhizophlyctis rosea]|nr:chitin deacetylase [Rhizophlyctis rosea]